MKSVTESDTSISTDFYSKITQIISLELGMYAGISYTNGFRYLISYVRHHLIGRCILIRFSASSRHENPRCMLLLGRLDQTFRMDFQNNYNTSMFHKGNTRPVSARDPKPFCWPSKPSGYVRLSSQTLIRGSTSHMTHACILVIRFSRQLLSI